MSTTHIIDSVYLIGKSDSMQQLYKMIGRVCNVDCSILLIGEKGSGRDKVAQALHFFSHRTAFPFYVIEGDQLLESSDEELIGIDESHQAEGTCYVKEMTSMPLFVQHQLLSIHKRKQYKCSHTNELKRHNLRFIVGNDGNIQEELENGKMPFDLFYDWNFLPLYVPPIRDRKEDIPILANHFLESLAREMKVSPKELSPEATEVLLAHDWPGNLEELRAAMQTALSLCRGSYIRTEHLSDLKSHHSEGSQAFSKLEMFLSSRLSSYIENSPLNFEGNLYDLLLPEIEKSLFTLFPLLRRLRHGAGQRPRADAARHVRRTLRQDISDRTHQKLRDGGTPAPRRRRCRRQPDRSGETRKLARAHSRARGAAVPACD